MNRLAAPPHAAALTTAVVVALLAAAPGRAAADDSHHAAAAAPEPRRATAPASAAAPTSAPPPRPEQRPSPAFERVKALAGAWEGTARSPGKEETLKTRAVYTLVSAGSAVMLVTDPGTPHEMVTMFHRDGDDVLATHYCAAQNQPRMRLTAGGGADRLAFEFMDGTNLRDFPGRMQSLALALTDASHHVQEWTYRDGEKRETMVLELARLK